jgi:hypothetical protein
MKYFYIVALFILTTACEDSLDFNYDPTEIEITIYKSKTGNEVLEGALVKVFESEEDYEVEINTGNSNLEVAKGFSDSEGVILFSEDDDIDDKKSYYFYVSFRDRAEFTDLDNLNENYVISSENIKQGGKTSANIFLQPSKSAVAFFGKELPTNSFPLNIFIDGENVGTLEEVAENDPQNASQNNESVLSFRLSQGERDYMVVSSTGCIWQGSLNLGATESFTPIPVENCEAGSITFWADQENVSNLPVSISLAPNDAIGSISSSVAEEPECFGGAGLSVSRASGTYSYFATSANGNCTWSGQFNVVSGECSKIKLTNCQ